MMHLDTETVVTIVACIVGVPALAIMAAVHLAQRAQGRLPGDHWDRNLKRWTGSPFR